MFQAKINRLKRIRLVRSRLGYRHKHIPISLPSSNCSTDKLKPIFKLKKSQRSTEKHGTIQLVNTHKCTVNHITLCSRVGDDGELRTMSIKYHFSNTMQRSITARFSVNDGPNRFHPCTDTTSVVGSNLNSSHLTILTEIELATIATFAQSFNIDSNGKI